MSFAVKAVIEKAEKDSDMCEGDVYIFNDPYDGGTHLSDFRLVKPIYRNGSVFCFIASVGHYHDVGGNVPGNYNPAATESFQEGVLIPPVKLYEKGKLRQDIVDIMLANSRLPGSLYGDLNGQINALELGLNRINELLDEYGDDVVLNAMSELRRRANKLMQSYIGELPDGVYQAIDWLDNDGIIDKPLKLALSIRVAGKELTLDFSGSSPACLGPVNISRSTTIAACYVAMKHVFPEVPANSGVLDSIEFIIPEESILSVKAPRPVGGYTETILRLIDLVFQAMADAAPDLTNGCAYGTINALSLAGYREDGRRWVMFSFFGGGHGGHPKGDGLSHGNAPISTATIPPLEILEAAYPVMFRQWALRADSGGAGKNRGGLGAVYEIELLEKSAEGFIFGERAKHAPPGVLGGKSAALNEFYFEQNEGDFTPPMGSKMVGIQLMNGQAVRLESPGGGGYGDPLLRSIDAVTEDIRLGYVSPENASSEYGVAVGPDGEIDVLATQGKRNRTLKVETMS